MASGSYCSTVQFQGFFSNSTVYTRNLIEEETPADGAAACDARSGLLVSSTRPVQLFNANRQLATRKLRDSLKRRKLHAFHLNIQCLRNKTHLLEDFLRGRDEFQLVSITEHWMESAEICSLSLDGYCVASYFCRQRASQHGGVVIFAGRSLDVLGREDIVGCSVRGVCEMAAVEIPEFGALLITVYRGTDRSTAAVARFVEIMDDVFRLVNFNKFTVIINGDLNIWFHADTPDRRTVCNYFNGYGLVPVIDAPTRGGKCLDNVFVDANANYKAYVESIYISDHFGTVLEMDLVEIQRLPAITHSAAPSLAAYRFTEIGLFRCFQLLQNNDWRFIEDSSQILGDRFRHFTELLHRALDVSFSKKPLRNGDFKCVNINWFDENLKNKRETFRMLSELYSNYPSEGNRRLLNDYRNYYRNEIKSAKMRANNNYIRNATNRNRALWNVVNYHRGHHRRSDIVIGADSFNTFFAKAADELVSKLPSCAVDFNYYLSKIEYEPPIFMDYFLAFSEIEIRDAIRLLKSKSSVDVYGLNSRVVKRMGEALVAPLTKLFNLSLREGTYPDFLKVSKIVPVFKVGKRDDVANYRPIACVPIISKIFEIIVRMRLTRYFEDNKLFTDAQFGFRVGKSTTYAINELVSFIVRGYDEKKYTAACFYDLSKAFDCVDPNILVKKLSYYGVPDNFVKLIYSYLSDRKIVTFTGTGVSSRQPVSLGIVQGSILGPTLFLIFINDLPMAVSEAKVLLFADDTTAVVQDSDPNNLLELVDGVTGHLHQWFAANRLAVNRDKSQTMNFSYKRGDVLRLNPAFVKFLGVLLDPHLTWEKHIDYVVNKLSKNTYVIRNLRGIVSDEVLRTAYYSLFQSVYVYDFLTWGHSPHTTEVFAIQRRVVRVMAGLRYRDDAKEAFIRLKILTVPCMYIYLCLSYIVDNVSSYRQHLDVHTYGTRCRQNLITDFIRLQHSRYSLNYFAVMIYNKLPESFRILPIKTFRATVKMNLLNRAYFSLSEYLSDTIGSSWLCL